MNSLYNSIIKLGNLYHNVGRIAEAVILSAYSKLQGLSSIISKTSEKIIQSNIMDNKDKVAIMRNSSLRSCHQGRRCFVIGNGPSLITQDLSHLGKEITFVMNGFYKHQIIKEWQPSYYCLADPGFFDSSDPMKKFFDELLLNVRDSTFLVPLYGKDVLLNVYSMPLRSAYFIKFRGDLGRRIDGPPDFTRIVPGVQSVAQLAIMAAMYMGCTPIYLLGLDHDWLAQRGMDRHFYEGKTIDGHPLAHGNVALNSYGGDLVSVLNLWNGYENLKRISNQNNIQILNATNGGFLDVFQRIDYASLS